MFMFYTLFFYLYFVVLFSHISVIFRLLFCFIYIFFIQPPLFKFIYFLISVCVDTFGHFLLRFMSLYVFCVSF